MKLSTTFIAALATCFLAAVSAEDCNSITDARKSFEYANIVLREIPYVDKVSRLLISALKVTEDLKGCGIDVLSAEDVKKIARCINRQDNLEGLTNGVDALSSSISDNKLPTPDNLDSYATDAQGLEADGATTGYQAALFNVDLAVTKLLLWKMKYISLEDSCEVNNAKGQAVGGIEQSLDWMEKLEDDLESILKDGRDVRTERKQCIEGEYVDCGYIDQPGCLNYECTKWSWDVTISYWCNLETYTYSTEASRYTSVSNRFIDSKINESEEKVKNKFFPTEYYDVKNTLEAEKDSLCDSLKKVDCGCLGKGICHCPKENNSFGAVL